MLIMKAELLKAAEVLQFENYYILKKRKEKYLNSVFCAIFNSRLCISVLLVFVSL